MPDPRTPLSPTAPRERFGGLDLLRGFALCGILVINMRYFALPMAGRALQDPNQPDGAFAATDFWSWFTTSVLFEDKMMALFSILFGAGIWLMQERGLLLHLRRMGVLLAIGVAHAVLLWFGDILTLYALCGLVVVLVRRWPPPLLIVLGLASATFAVAERPVLGLLAEAAPVEAAEAPPEAAADARAATAGQPGPEEAPGWRERLQRGQGEAFRAAFAAETERTMHEGGWAQQVAWRARLAPWWQGAGFLLSGLLWNGGLMVLGMGLMGTGFLAGRMRAGPTLALGLAALLLGLVLSAAGLWPRALAPLGRMEAMWTPGEPPSEAVGRWLGLAYLARSLGVFLAALGWAGLLVGLHAAGLFRRVLAPFQAVGRMALTHYLSHTVICVLVFEGWAGGRWNQWRYHEQLQLVALILAVQLLLSPLWLAVFRFGPAEWLWRSLSYGRRQPFRRVPELPESPLEATAG